MIFSLSKQLFSWHTVLTTCIRVSDSALSSSTVRWRQWMTVQQHRAADSEQWAVGRRQQTADSRQWAAVLLTKLLPPVRGLRLGCSRRRGAQPIQLLLYWTTHWNRRKQSSKLHRNAAKVKQAAPLAPWETLPILGKRLLYNSRIQNDKTTQKKFLFPQTQSKVLFWHGTF